jgi:hypothetical protein
MMIELDECKPVLRVYLTPIRAHCGSVSPLGSSLNELDCIARLLLAHRFHRCPRELSVIIRAHCFRRPRYRRSMKKQNHPRDFVQTDQIRALAAQLFGSDKITSARGEGAATTWNVEPIEPRQAEPAR